MKRDGPPPKPTHLKLLAGNPGKRPLNDREAKPDIGLPTCPPELPPLAKKEWKRTGKELVKLSLMTKIDKAAFAAYCAAYARWIEAESQVEKTGTIVKAPESGYPMMNPYLSVSNKEWRKMYTMLTEFGMTPASRSRIKAAPPEEPTSKLERFLKRGKST